MVSQYPWHCHLILVTSLLVTSRKRLAISFCNLYCFQNIVSVMLAGMLNTGGVSLCINVGRLIPIKVEQHAGVAACQHAPSDIMMHDEAMLP